MSLKLILVSIDGTLVDSTTRKINISIAKEFIEFAKKMNGAGVKVALWSNKKWSVGESLLEDWIKTKFNYSIPIHGFSYDNAPPRQKANSVAPIKNHYKVKNNEIILIGSQIEDLQAAVNNHLLLIKPEWYPNKLDYGFPVKTIEEVERFCLLFGIRQHPIFWELNIKDLCIAASGPFSTQVSDYSVFGSDAKSFAKFGTGHAEFWFYFTISSLYFSGLLDNVNYICMYPGHKISSDPNKNGMAEFLSKLAKCFNIGFYHDLILRTSNAPKSQGIKSYERKFLTQFNSIQLNKYPHKYLNAEPNKSILRLNNKTVLVVDDFCTSGRSLEAARTLLNAAGAQVRLYTWLKTINTSYQYVTLDTSTITPYSPSKQTIEPNSQPIKHIDGIVDALAPKELQNIFTRFIEWPL